jgi:tetrapyrrole methylase family protein/MazG family protein
MKTLRSPSGCPWDLKQTHSSLVPYLLEETYEVIEAIEDNQADRMAEELGDLLLQIVFHAQVASEDGRFDIEDVAASINKKLIHRHPHIFKQKQDLSPEEVTQNWEQLKLAEKKGHRKSALDGIPKVLPALLKAFRLQQKASRFGFDWENSEQVYEKVGEEMEELKEALDASDHDQIEEEIGDLLFSVVNLARFLEIDPESALARTNKKFLDRFLYVEKKLAEQGRSLSDSDLAEMDALWDESKSLMKKES